MNKPESLNICGIPYSVFYFDNVLDVDPDKREMLYGHHDLKTQSIRVFDKDCKNEFVWSTILHEVLHGIADITRMSILDINGKDGEQKHNEIDCLSAILTDFLFRNDLIKLEANK
jgi:hypothetical protein